MVFDWEKFQKEGKENSCMLYTLHPDIAKDQFKKNCVNAWIISVITMIWKCLLRFEGGSYENRRYGKMECRRT